MKLAPKFTLMSWVVYRLSCLTFHGICTNAKNGFKCIAKEADLTCELLRHGASPSDDYLINQSSEMRIGVSKEAETMCKWMRENDMLLDVLPEDLEDSRIIRIQTLYVMIDILEKSSSSAASGNKIDKEESASEMVLSVMGMALLLMKQQPSRY
uniref:Uncharacterized protein n=1 Tax=Setaria italica TaxID=4555 RepID=K4AME7_SETIT